MLVPTATRHSPPPVGVVAILPAAFVFGQGLQIPDVVLTVIVKMSG